MSQSSSNNPLRTTPVATALVSGLCIVIYLLQLLLDFDIQSITMCPRLVLYLHEYYRIVTSTLFHANLMHIGMNMMSTFAIGALLEKRMGTLGLVMTLSWAILLSGLVYLMIAWTAYAAFGSEEWMYTQSVGFSGILFHMTVLECNLSSTESRSLFGVVNVPTFLYPWVLLILLQFMIPGLSFLGHLSGILTGTLQYYGVFQHLLVSDHFLREMESWSGLNWLTSLQSFCATPSGNVLSRQPGASSLLHAIRNGVGMLFKLLRDVLETLRVCIFGRGHSSNGNIRFTPLSQVELGGGGGGGGGGRVLGTSLEEDDDWGGLPTTGDRGHVSRLV
jgi:membrane associated rhomboid family serine protease